MNESEFRRIVRAAVGQPPAAPSPERLHAYLVERTERRRQRIVATVAFGLAVAVVVVLLGGYRLLSLAQRPTTPAATPPAVPSAAPATRSQRPRRRRRRRRHRPSRRPGSRRFR